VGPLYLFLIHHRFPAIGIGKRERRGVLWTNGALLALAVGMSLTIGIKTYLLIQLPILLFAGTAGVWLFYIQHQFDGMRWERGADWDFVDAALRGSSYYKLPRLLQWFTGNIGFHHIHHLSPGIPNYNLEKCHGENPMFQEVKAVTLWSSMKSISFRFWDEERKKLVGYGRLRAIRRQGARSPVPRKKMTHQMAIGDQPFNSPAATPTRDPGEVAGPGSYGESSCENS
jgi:omega-6 fatty acid desaturase (delta-12 desaturase)